MTCSDCSALHGVNPNLKNKNKKIKQALIITKDIFSKTAWLGTEATVMMNNNKSNWLYSKSANKKAFFQARSETQQKKWKTW